MLGVAQPEQTLATYKDALRRLSDKLHYLNTGNNRFWFDTRPNLRREMEDRKRRFEDKSDVYPHIRERITKSFASGVFAGVHVFANSQDIPDDWSLRLVVTSPDQRYSKLKASVTESALLDTLKKRGEQPRAKQNRLIFLCAEDDGFSRLADQVRIFLAWQSIVNDGNQMKITLDNLMARQAKDAMTQAEETIKRMVKETYKWLLVPYQEAKPGQGVSDVKWESYALNSSAVNLTQEIERVLKENELLITEWSPFHLNNLLKYWFWKTDQTVIEATYVWQQTCQYLYLPRLRDSMVYQNTIANGVQSRDFFALAQGKENDKYVGFVFGKTTSVILDEDLLLIEPNAATAYELSIQPAPTAAPLPPVQPGVVLPNPTIAPQPTMIPTSAPAAKPTQFYASVELDALRAKAQFADIFDEVIQQISTKPGAKINISIDISAEIGSGFDETTQRAIKENCSVLKFKQAEFEG
jgi:predicted AAA+ superfamily ATPase